MPVAGQVPGTGVSTSAGTANSRIPSGAAAVTRAWVHERAPEQYRFVPRKPPLASVAGSFQLRARRVGGPHSPPAARQRRRAVQFGQDRHRVRMAFGKPGQGQVLRGQIRERGPPFPGPPGAWQRKIKAPRLHRRGTPRRSHATRAGCPSPPLPVQLRCSSWSAVLLLRCRGLCGHGCPPLPVAAGFIPVWPGVSRKAAASCVPSPSSNRPWRCWPRRRSGPGLSAGVLDAVGGRAWVSAAAEADRCARSGGNARLIRRLGVTLGPAPDPEKSHDPPRQPAARAGRHR